MTAVIEKNGQLLDELEKERDSSNLDPREPTTPEDGPTQNDLNFTSDPSKKDTVRRVSSGIYQTASQTLGYGMDSVKRAASGLGAGLSRAGQNVADKLQKSPKLPKAMRRRSGDELSTNILDESDDDEDGDDGENSSLMVRKSSKEVAARKKRQERLKKEDF